MAENIKDHELRVYDTKDPVKKEGGRNWDGYRLRLVQWIIDGKATEPKLEKRKYFITEDGDTRMGKAEGLGYRDLDKLKEHWAEMRNLMKNPPSYEPPAGSTEAEEVPF